MYILRTRLVPGPSSKQTPPRSLQLCRQGSVQSSLRHCTQDNRPPEVIDVAVQLSPNFRPPSQRSRHPSPVRCFSDVDLVLGYLAVEVRFPRRSILSYNLVPHSSIFYTHMQCAYSHSISLLGSTPFLYGTVAWSRCMDLFVLFLRPCPPTAESLRSATKLLLAS